ncbi:MAG: ankyrin repeat domain-containing protein [Parachlamydiaceae bacterium]|nr:ankyrin repeat domain-containing protein [Parachlamydiaceae bacterium]
MQINSKSSSSNSPYDFWDIIEKNDVKLLSEVFEADPKIFSLIMQWLIKKPSQFSENTNLITKFIKAVPSNVENELLARINLNVKIIRSISSSSFSEFSLSDAETILGWMSNPNITDFSGSTPLHYACEVGHLTIVENLLEQGANSKLTDISGLTPLHSACRYGKISSAAKLLKHGALINARNHFGATPLNDACQFGLNRTIKFLLTKGADVNISDELGNSPLHVALMYKANAVAHLLIENKANPNAVNQFGLTPLHMACKSGNVEVVSSLLQNGADPEAIDRWGNTPLHFAGEKGDQKNVISLLLKNVNPNGVNHLGQTPLHIICKYGHFKALAALYVLGKPIFNSVDSFGNTALHYACINDFILLTRVILNLEGVNPCIKNNALMSPLHCALAEGNSVAEFYFPNMGLIDEVQNLRRGNRNLELELQWCVFKWVRNLFFKTKDKAVFQAPYLLGMHDVIEHMIQYKNVHLQNSIWAYLGRLYPTITKQISSKK